MSWFAAFLRDFLSDESGISTVEYALLLTFVGGAIIVAGGELGDAVGNEIDSVADYIENGTAAAAC